ncbi:hypothetical protein FRC0552_00624 [Corynebacterium diphtheriae]|nr:hypothetical protein FRC0552_00624 [Corynebacterium diphtheriae]CAB1032861.1 hypothetical protein FRC0551_00624 [Corynebacterium diphtheriae]
MCVSCSRIRDYVYPWSVPGCGCGGGGVFVITDSWSWFRTGGYENTPTTHQDHQPLGACSISSCSRIRDYVYPCSGLRCGCGGGGGVFVITDSRTRIRTGGYENTPTSPCYRITAPVNKRGRPVRGSINSIFDYSGPVLGVDRRYWLWNPAVLSACDNKSRLPWSIHCW